MSPISFLKHNFEASRITGLIVASFLIAGCEPTVVTQSDTQPHFEYISDGDEFPVPSGRAKRGYLTVPADWENPTASTHKLPVAIIPADESKPKRSPVIMISGGPGSGSLSAASYPGAYPWVGDRDFIIFGQRGTKHAKPALLCPKYNLVHFGPDATARAKAASNCRDDFQARGINLSNFHTKAIAADVNALRQALGYDDAILFGLSYGTRIALTVARDFPGTVDRMVLDSVLPHSVRYDREAPESLKYVLNRIVDRCHANADCRSAYDESLKEGLARIEATPETPLKILTETGETIEMGPDDLIKRLFLEPTSRTSEIPSLLAAIAKEEDRNLVTERPTEVPVSNFDWGMRLSVWCSEAWPHSTPEEKPFAGLDRAVISDEVCEIWNVDARPLSDRTLTTSDVPTLLISGEFDIATPSEWASEAAETLSNSRVIDIPFGFHTETTNWGGDGCALSLAATFIGQEQGSLDELDIGCVEARKDSDFFEVD